MGHVIGVGTLWDRNNLVDNGLLVYTGANALNVWTNDWGCSLDPPVQVVEDDVEPNGVGVVGGHWQEACFGNELMTPSLDSGPNPISRLTIASIQDLGYVADLDAADSYDGTDTT